MLKSELYAKEILKYLAKRNKKMFKARQIARDLDWTLQKVGAGIKYLKKKGRLKGLDISLGF